MRIRSATAPTETVPVTSSRCKSVAIINYKCYGLSNKGKEGGEGMEREGRRRRNGNATQAYDGDTEGKALGVNVGGFVSPTFVGETVVMHNHMNDK
jgi:hypothetical protein